MTKHTIVLLVLLAAPLVPPLLALLLAFFGNKSLPIWFGRKFSRVEGESWDVAAATSQLRSDMDAFELFLSALKQGIPERKLQPEHILQSLNNISEVQGRSRKLLLKLMEAKAHGFIFSGGAQEEELDKLRRRYIEANKTVDDLKHKYNPRNHISAPENLQDVRQIARVREDVEYNIGYRLMLRFVAVYAPLLVAFYSWLLD